MSTLASCQVSVEISALLVPICQARDLQLLVPFPDVLEVDNTTLLVTSL